MKSLGFVDALAALLSDDQLRAQFVRDKSEVAKQLGMAEADKSLLMELDVEQLEQQAQCLLLKRQSEAADHLPRTWKQLGADGSRLFQEYAKEAAWPAGHRRHTLDALAFCEFLQTQQATAVSELEYSVIRFQAGTRRFAIACVKDFHVNDRAHRALLVFFRGKQSRARHYAFCLGRIFNPWWR